MKILTMVPIQAELDFLVQAWAEKGFQAQNSIMGRLPVVLLPEIDVTLACGGLGKVQFAVQTQHLLDVCPAWDLVICAGAAGALVDGLSIGDLVVATETVEHDIHNRFGKPLLPKFAGAEAVLSGLRSVASHEESFQVHFGPMASGDEDVVDADRRSMLHQRTGALAVAWEGVGGARACHFSGSPFVEVRGITDEADSDAASDFEENLGGTMKNVVTLIASWLGMRVAP
jgi:adenosylhomocysteine nucleosidase